MSSVCFLEDPLMRLEIISISDKKKRISGNHIYYQINFVPNNGKRIPVGRSYLMRRDAEKTAWSITKYLKHVEVKI